MHRRGYVCLCAHCPFCIWKKQEPVQCFPLAVQHCVPIIAQSHTQSLGDRTAFFTGKRVQHTGVIINRRVMVLSKSLLPYSAQFTCGLSSGIVLPHGMLVLFAALAGRQDTLPRPIKRKQARSMVGLMSVLKHD